MEPITLTCNNCDKTYDVAFPSHAKTRNGEPRRFCTDACAREWRGGLYARGCFDRKLLTVDQVALLLGVTDHRVNDLRKADDLAATEVNEPGMLRAGFGYQPADVQQFMGTRQRRKTGPPSADAILAAAGELSAEVAASYCHISYGVLMAARRQGRVAATEHRVPRIWRPVYGFKEADLDNFKRQEAKRRDHWARRALDPEFVASLSRSRGGDGAAAAERARKRAVDLAARRGGRPAQPQLGRRWYESFQDMRERERVTRPRTDSASRKDAHAHDDGTPASDRELYRTVALQDYVDHPEDWTYDPAADLDRAAQRVQAGIRKYLQISRTKRSVPTI